MKSGHVLADGFDAFALLSLAAITPEISAGGLVKFRSVFDADDSSKGKLRRHEQCAALARAKINEGKFCGVNRERRNRFSYQVHGRGLVVNSVYPVPAIHEQIAQMYGLRSLDAMFQIERVCLAR